MPPRDVIPKPKQKPHPPLWVACSRRETILHAARNGLGALSFAFVEPEQAKGYVDDYYRLIASHECVPAGFSVNPKVAVVVPMLCHADEQTAIERGIDGAHFFGYSLSHYYIFGDHVPGRTDVWAQFERNRRDLGFARELINPDAKPLGVKLLEAGLGSLRGAVGTPAQVTELIERYELAGVDQVIFVSQAGQTKHEHICESMELFAKEVMPQFAERAEQREAAKAKRLERACEEALERRQPARPAPEYTIRPGGEATPAQVIVAARSNGSGMVPSRALRRLLEAALGSVVGRLSDRQLRFLAGTGPGLKVIFKGMERAFVLANARGFEGEILYDLRHGDESRSWVVEIRGGRARARQGEAKDPALTLRMEVPCFVRIVLSETNPAQLVMQGELELQGDLELAARLNEMFGQEPIT